MNNQEVGHRSKVDKSSAYGAKNPGSKPNGGRKFICVIVYLYVL